MEKKTESFRNHQQMLRSQRCDPQGRWETHTQALTTRMTQSHRSSALWLILLTLTEKMLQCVLCAWKAASCGATGPTQSCAGRQEPEASKL